MQYDSSAVQYWSRSACKRYATEAIAVMKATSRPGDLIVLQHTTAKYKQYESTHATSAVVIKEHLAFLEGLLKTLPGVMLVLAGDIDGIISKAGTSCVGNPSACARTLATVRGSADSTRMHNAYTQWAQNHERMVFWDYLPLLCKSGKCGPMVPGTNSLMMFDANHFTVAGSKYLAPFWCEQFGKVGLFGTNGTACGGVAATTPGDNTTAAPFATTQGASGDAGTAATTTSNTAAPRAATPTATTESATTTAAAGFNATTMVVATTMAAYAVASTSGDPGAAAAATTQGTSATKSGASASAPSTATTPTATSAPSAAATITTPKSAAATAGAATRPFATSAPTSVAIRTQSATTTAAAGFSTTTMMVATTMAAYAVASTTGDPGAAAAATT